MKKLIKHIRVWNHWRKRNMNGRFYKLCVLLGLANSPTFWMCKICDSIDIAARDFKYVNIEKDDENGN